MYDTLSSSQCPSSPTSHAHHCANLQARIDQRIRAQLARAEAERLAVAYSRWLKKQKTDCLIAAHLQSVKRIHEIYANYKPGLETVVEEEEEHDDEYEVRSGEERSDEARCESSGDSARRLFSARRFAPLHCEYLGNSLRSSPKPFI